MLGRTTPRLFVLGKKATLRKKNQLFRGEKVEEIRSKKDSQLNWMDNRTIGKKPISQGRPASARNKHR